MCASVCDAELCQISFADKPNVGSKSAPFSFMGVCTLSMLVVILRPYIKYYKETEMG